MALSEELEYKERQEVTTMAACLSFMETVGAAVPDTNLWTATR
jgi:hypothetical protein